MTPPAELKPCCLCGERIEGWGHNPAPVVPEVGWEARCCTSCNETKVLPARLRPLAEGGWA